MTMTNENWNLRYHLQYHQKLWNRKKNLTKCARHIYQRLQITEKLKT